MNKVEIRSTCGGWRDRGNLNHYNPKKRTLSISYKGGFINPNIFLDPNFESLHEFVSISIFEPISIFGTIFFLIFVPISIKGNLCGKKSKLAQNFRLFVQNTIFEPILIDSTFDFCGATFGCCTNFNLPNLMKICIDVFHGYFLDVFLDVIFSKFSNYDRNSGKKT